MATKKTTTKATKPKSRAEEAMTGGEVPQAWPCGEKCEPGKCSHRGRRIVGTVEQYDPTGGRNQRGFVDIKPQDGGPSTRFWLNQNAQTVLKTAMRKSSVGEHELEGAEIAVEFLDWVRTSRGFHTRTFLIGVASTERMEPGEEEE